MLNTSSVGSEREDITVWALTTWLENYLKISLLDCQSDHLREASGILIDNLQLL